jgi:hypothetical protein
MVPNLKFFIFQFLATKKYTFTYILKKFTFFITNRKVYPLDPPNQTTKRKWIYIKKTAENKNITEFGLKELLSLSLSLSLQEKKQSPAEISPIDEINK